MSKNFVDCDNIMKKVVIITLYGYENYGNRLQMYAVQKVYKTLGFDSEIIKQEKLKYNEPIIIRLKIVIKYMLFIRSNLKTLFLKKLRIYNFKKHAKLHIKESKKYVNPLAIDKEFHKKYSFLSVGSDQIWGWFNYIVADFVFLQFAPIEKRIAFSPSFGSSTIDEKYTEIFTQGLQGFKQISVRESSGAEIVKKLINKEATVLCDPTMCL
jgi:hypothetical protein